MKFLARTFILLVVVNGLLLYMHYKEAGNATAKNSDRLTYSQEIEVTNRSDGLYIRHHFKELSAGPHEIIWPKMSTNRSCYVKDTETCSRLDEDATTFLEGDADRQSIMYIIPKDQPMEQMKLFENVFVMLDGSEPTSGLVHITDEMGLGGLWVSGLKLIGNKEMSLIDYSLFSGNGKLTDLYWQKSKQPLAYEGDRLAVFSAGTDFEFFKEIDAKLLLVDAEYSTMVINDNDTAVASERFNIVNKAEAEKVANLLLVNNTSAKFSIPKEERIIAEIIASLISQQATGMEKSRAVYKELIDNLTEIELQQVVKKVNSMAEKVVDATVMNEVIEEVTGYKTSYFTKNSDVDTVLYPFLLEDPRTVYLEGKENLDVAVILKAGKILYPATEIARALGFEVRLNEQSLYIEGVGRNFRFPLKEPFYVHNERKYNLKSVAFERIGDEFYFEESPFIRIFIIGIEKTAETIEITPRVKFEEKGTAN